jgi:hypothetical protein
MKVKLISFCSTVGAQNRGSFLMSRIQDRRQDLMEALELLTRIERHKATARALCTMFYHKLPVELREMVYHYITPSLTGEIREPNPSYFYMPEPSVSCQPYHPVKPKSICFRPTHSEDPTYPLPFQPDQETLGYEVANELSRYFHHHTRFDFGDNSFDVIKCCFEGGVFTHPVRKISIDMDVNTFSSAQVDGLVQWVDQDETHMERLDGLVDLDIKNLELTIFTSATRWYQHVEHEQDLQKDEFRRYLELLFPKLNRLHSAGCKTKLVHGLDILGVPCCHRGLSPSLAHYADAPCPVHYRSRKRVRSLLGQDASLVLTPGNAEFSVEGYIRKLEEVSPDDSI